MFMLHRKIGSPAAPLVLMVRSSTDKFPNNRVVMPKITLFSTSNLRQGRSEHLQRMVDSIARAKVEDPSIDVHLYLLLQNVPDDAADPDFPDWISTRRINHQISLSAARNLLMREVVKAGVVTADSIYAFPDDDCWYPEKFLTLVAGLFRDKPEIDFWFCRYSSTPEIKNALPTEKPALQKVISRASSNTFFFRGRLLPELQTFDETLGVGARLNGGEDTDYAIRAFYLARGTLFTDAPLVGHRDHDSSLKPKYFPGTLYAIAAHKTRSLPGIIAFVRKLLVGASLVAGGKLTLSSYIAAVRNA
ncbi:hypothetical protein FHT78_002017 [Rhizobium sp. BK196]|uniref:hypothetical protein n=1 Tax=unclassified Rhizobium TaxID=2613769 RepID=UPI00161F1DC6|nr:MULTISPECIES: hypothetical protein [unclassified Rhizobium]MBB3310274.1 hypothetical protein [Rhizobium sp. BK196]MBB3464862.1 hypothetical protein [Rhizobium sp. BK377]